VGLKEITVLEIILNRTDRGVYPNYSNAATRRISTDGALTSTMNCNKAWMSQSQKERIIFLCFDRRTCYWKPFQI